MFHDIMSVCIIIYNIIIENEFDTHGSIIYLNVIFLPKVGMIIDKNNNLNGSLLALNKLKIKKTCYVHRNALIEHLQKIYDNNVSGS